MAKLMANTAVAAVKTSYWSFWSPKQIEIVMHNTMGMSNQLCCWPGSQSTWSSCQQARAMPYARCVKMVLKWKVEVEKL